MHYLLPKKKKAQLTLSIHPQAMPAFQFAQRLNRIFDSTLLYPPASSLLCKHQTLHAIKTSPYTLEVVSGFEYINFDLTAHNHINNHTYIYPTDMSINEIETLAWSGIAHVLLSSIRSNSLGQLYNDINQLMPSHVIHTLFGKSNLSEQKLADITSVSRTTIAKQRRQIKNNKDNLIPQKAPSIFELLSKELINE